MSGPKLTDAEFWKRVRDNATDDDDEDTIMIALTVVCATAFVGIVALLTTLQAHP